MDRESIDLDLSRYLLVLKRRWLLGSSIFLGTVALGLFATTLLKPTYEAEGRLWFRVPAYQTLGSDLLPNRNEGNIAGDLRSLVSTDNPISTQMEIISSPPLLEKVIQKTQLKNDEGELITVDDLLEKITLQIIGGTDVLLVSYQSKNPEEASAVVNALMDLYIETDISAGRAEAQLTRGYMAEQLPNTQVVLDRAQTALRVFKQQNNIANLSEETRTSVEIIARLDNEIATVKAQLADVTVQKNELRQEIGLTSQEAIAFSSLSQSPAVQGTLSQFQEVERQLASERGRFQDKTPIVVELEARKNKLRSLLQQQITQTLGKQIVVPFRLLQMGEFQQNSIQRFLQLELQSLGLKQQMNSLLDSRFNREKRMKALPKLAETQRELERQLEVAESTYQTLLKKVQELQLAENANTSNARIVAKALVPEQPVSGKKLIVVAIGAMLGVFLSTTTILVLEIRDRSLKTLKEIREAFMYPFLGALPLSSSNKIFRDRDAIFSKPAIAVIDRPDSFISEIYRTIQANLKFLNSDKVIKTIVVTSAVSKEGKSTVSANLAAAIAQLGRKVLLIDANMRNPSQHQIWKLTNAVGLSEVLIGQSEFETAIDSAMDCLDVLTAGVKPPNPLALLDSKRMNSLIKDVSSQYDCVIIDAPSALATADALTLSQISDGILLVSRPKIINHNNIMAVRELLEKTNHNILGLVVNGVINSYEFSNPFAIEVKEVIRDREPYNYYDLISESEQENTYSTHRQDASQELLDDLPQISDKKSFHTVISRSDLEKKSTTEIDRFVKSLQHKWQELLSFVEEQEEELNEQDETVREWQNKLNNAPQRDRERLEQELAYEKEKQRMLNATLIGQRYNLQKNQEILYYYQDILSRRQNRGHEINKLQK
jgi:capsular exopolysaccharide synthesis family protein